MLSDDEVTVMVFRNSSAVIDMQIMHDETGLRVQGRGNKRHHLYMELMEDLSYVVANHERLMDSVSPEEREQDDHFVHPYKICRCRKCLADEEERRVARRLGRGERWNDDG